MKKILSILAITAVFVACNSNPKTGSETATSVATDAAAAAHNAFTDKAREVQMNGISDTIVSSDGSTYVKVSPKESEAAPVKVIPVAKERSTVRHTSPTRTSKPRSTTRGAATSKSESSTVSNDNAGTSGTSSTETGTTTSTETKKKGWSKAANGAVIGAGTGAAAGAIISKKKGKGAIIGGIIGAAGGYMIGRSKDKKDGRL